MGTSQHKGLKINRLSKYLSSTLFISFSSGCKGKIKRNVWIITDLSVLREEKPGSAQTLSVSQLPVVTLKSSVNLSFSPSEEKSIWEVTGAPRQSHGLWGEQDWCSGASIPRELDQGDGVHVADQHGHRHPPVVHPEHPLGELWGRLHWENNQPW